MACSNAHQIRSSLHFLGRQARAHFVMNPIRCAPGGESLVSSWTLSRISTTLITSSGHIIYRRKGHAESFWRVYLTPNLDNKDSGKSANYSFIWLVIVLVAKISKRSTKSGKLLEYSPNSPAHGSVLNLKYLHYIRAASDPVVAGGEFCQYSISTEGKKFEPTIFRICRQFSITSPWHHQRGGGLWALRWQQRPYAQALVQ